MMGLRFAEKVTKGFFDAMIDSGATTLLARVNRLLHDRGAPAFVVGGLVRDMLLDRSTVDIDIAVDGDAPETARAVADALGGKYVLLDDVNRVARVLLPKDGPASAVSQWQLDFSTLAGSIEQDLARRDFTIDAMAVELDRLVTGQRAEALIDPFNGRDDLERGLVRSVDDSVFEADAARLLRAVRLAAELGFSIEADTEAQIRRDARLIVTVAGERVREELLRLLAVPGSGRRVADLDRLGLLTAMIPELEEARDVAQPPEHFWNVLDHSLMVVVAADFLLRQGTWQHTSAEVLHSVPWSDELAACFAGHVSSGSCVASLLKLAALLHDIAKPQTKATDDNGRTRFLGHAQQGAEVAAAVMERLRFSSRETRLVATMVEHHLRPVQMSQDGLPTRRAIYRYFRDVGEAAIGTLFLSLADHLATRGPHLDLSGWEGHTAIVDCVLVSHCEQPDKVRPAKLVDGHDLMSTFGLSPGARLGRLLDAVREAQAAGELTSRQEALSYVRNHLLTEEEVDVR